MVIGGLMEERVGNTDTGVPYLSKMPFTGNLFKKSEKSTEVVETVIFIKATIVPGFGVDPADKKLYRKFTNDRRPLTF
jgi:general secretion pathway protein D